MTHSDGATTLIGVVTFFAGAATVEVFVEDAVLAVDVEAHITTEPPLILEPTFTLPEEALNVHAA